MARFYAKFDSGSSGWVGSFDNITSDGCFDRLRIAASSASAALLRDGLIASRSALSIDIYQDLDATNKDGSKGIYFPPDSGPFSTDTSTFVSWSTAYTSSVNGIIIPTDYRTRPTSSIVSTQTTLVGPTSPTDPVGASYTVYNNASAAVKAVVDSIQDGAGTATTPFTRQGTTPSKTLHSVWHNETLDYFAWDDYSPGQATMTMDINGLDKGTSPPEVYPGGDPVNTAAIIIFSVDTFQYPNDGNPDGTIGLEMQVETTASSAVATLALGYNATTHGGPLTIGTNSSGTGPANQSGFPGGGNSSWSWDKDAKQLQWTLGLNAGEYTLNCLGRIYDVTISAHSGPATVVTTFPTTATNVFAVRAGSPS